MTAPPSAEEVAEIAKGLTQDQKDSVRRLVPGENRMCGYGADSGCPGLIIRVGVNHPLFGSHYRLTPLGVAVRNHLIGETR